MTSRILVVAFSTLALGACRHAGVTSPAPADRPITHSVVPIPATIDLTPGDSFLVTPRTAVFVEATASPEVEAVGTYAAS